MAKKKSGKSAYAKAGVDYTLIEPFKQYFIEVAKKTAKFPNRRKVYIDTTALHSHGGTFEYRGKEKHKFCNTLEGLGNRNWIAEWMYRFSGLGNTFYTGIGIDNAMMAFNDVIAQGAMPISYSDEVAAGDSEWFDDKKRAADLAQGYYEGCEMAGYVSTVGQVARCDRDDEQHRQFRELLWRLRRRQHSRRLQLTDRSFPHAPLVFHVPKLPLVTRRVAAVCGVWPDHAD